MSPCLPLKLLKVKLYPSKPLEKATIPKNLAGNLKNKPSDIAIKNLINTLLHFIQTEILCNDICLVKFLQLMHSQFPRRGGATLIIARGIAYIYIISQLSFRKRATHGRTIQIILVNINTLCLLKFWLVHLRCIQERKSCLTVQKIKCAKNKVVND